MTHVVAVIQARMGSTRLPGKVLMPLGDVPVLGWCVRAAQAITGVDQVMVATSDDEADDAVASWCDEVGIACVRGSQTDVLSRYEAAVHKSKATHVLRLTADCPLLDPAVCAATLALLVRGGYDYVSNASPRQWPDGLDCEAMTADALLVAAKEAMQPSDREHVTAYLNRQQHRFNVGVLDCPLPDLERERWTLDYPQDYKFLQAIAQHIPAGHVPTYLEVLEIIAKNSIKHEALPEAESSVQDVIYDCFSTSQALYEEAKQYIPQASQTYSKSAQQFPAGFSPLFLTHGIGGNVWDVDGNKLVDMVSGLLPISLGYQDADVNAAVRAQLNRGITFSLPTTLEMQLAKLMRQMVPCAQSVRFGKNGSDGTAAAIRVARAFTGRERVMVCGYHGWQDWYIGATSRHKGVPKAVQELTHVVAYNKLAAVEQMLAEHPNEFAAMIMEPVNVASPDKHYFSELKALLKKHGTLLIFDEVITGFRLHQGGAQAYFNAEPDLACFGKAMGNGMPISALAGRKDVMDEMDHIFFSGTFGGEALSLAASVAVCEKIQREPVIDTLWQHGAFLRQGVEKLLVQYKLDQAVRLLGLDPWVILDFVPQAAISKEAMKTFFIMRMARAGVLVLGSHNVCYAHSKADLMHVLRAYDATLKDMAHGLKEGTLEAELPCPVIYPAFTVR